MKRIDAIDILGKRKSGDISTLFDNYLSKFSVKESPMLFDLEFPELRNSLKRMICYACGCKLKTAQNGDVYCNSARHKRVTRQRLFIRKESVDKLIK